jgi:hypothetical protein
MLELIPEVYLDTAAPSAAEMTEAVQGMVRETAAFLLRFGREAQAGAFNETN